MLVSIFISCKPVSKITLFRDEDLWRFLIDEKIPAQKLAQVYRE
jgi:hypothetical protein